MSWIRQHATPAVIVVIGLLIFLSSSILANKFFDAQAEQVDALRARAIKSEQRADANRERADRAEARADRALIRAGVERDQQRAITCDQYDQLTRFAAVVAAIIIEAPDLTPERRAELEDFTDPPPRPAECPPAT